MIDPYKTLGVSHFADAAAIRTAFTLAAKTHHPDRGGNPDKFKQVSQAYEILKDPKRRALWDEFGEDSLRVGFDPATARTRAGAASWASSPEAPKPNGPAGPEASTRDVRVHDDRPWWAGVRVDNGSFGACGAFGPKGPGDF